MNFLWRLPRTMAENNVSWKIAAAGLLLTAQTTMSATQASRPADLILWRGTVLTVDAHDSVGQAIAIRDGKVLEVGPDAAISALAGPRTKLVDLHGRVATPGLIDSHAHVAEGGLGEVISLQLGNAASIAEIVQRVRDRAPQVKAGEWIQGSGWDEGKLAEHRYVLASDLDAAAPNNPVWLEHTTGHYGVANSYALRLGKIAATTPNPPAGTIDRDGGGSPTGVLKEEAARLVTTLIPAPTAGERREGLLKMIETLHREGMTAFKDPDITQPDWDAYRSLLDSGQLSVHVCVLWHAGTTVASAQEVIKTIQALPRPPHSLGDGRLLSCGAKIYMDGSGAGRTAWVYKEWNKNQTEVDHGNYGYPALDPMVYQQMVRLLHQANINVGTHAIGDRAIDWVVDTYAAVLREKPTRGLRHSIIHANFPTDHAVEVMAALEQQYDAGYPEMQPTFIWWIGDNYAGNLGRSRALRLEPLKTMLARGVHWSGGSDFDVTPIPARYGLWAAAERETLKGTYGLHPFGTAEDVDVNAALRAYTAEGARQLFLEDRIGSLEPGKEADIAIWDRNLYTVPKSELKEIKCKMTLFHGEIVYEAHEPLS
jgi:predicted amidohydrolase YtcJ